MHLHASIRCRNQKKARSSLQSERGLHDSKSPFRLSWLLPSCRQSEAANLVRMT